MTTKLLYFPYINIPNNNWTVKSLLYWDTVGIIVPQGFIDNPQKHNQFTLDLLQSDLIESIFPYEYTSQVDNFDKEFLKLIENPFFNIERRQTNFINNLVSRIHVQKFGRETMEYLVELKIAAKDRIDWDWYFVEAKTANLIMLYLATIIGKVGSFTPATDKIKNINLSVSQYYSINKTNKIRETLLDDLLPYPIEPDLTKLRKFKDKYHEELTSFRILFEQYIFLISKSENAEDQANLRDFKFAEINDKRNKILSELNQSKIGQIVFGGICGIIGTVIGNAGAFALLNSAYAATQGLGNPATQKDFSYLALIDKKLKG